MLSVRKRGPDERFGIKRLISTRRSNSRASIRDSTIGETLDEFLDDEVSTGEILERETGALGIDGAGRGVRLGAYGRIVRHFDGCRQFPASMGVCEKRSIQ